ncbi:hypothetical protein T12_3081 [Trichinella patagoniensis]|uniref:Integrase catalytic domain-containing protein n=1 Tax=Trichinella patagoniensis TaxID=990121 RepID=A0A0V0Z485_9BILA|nr:hypothetical protein T12_3081 [Trichinella patagoniensis]
MDGTLVKRCNCTLLDKLPTMCNESLKTWDELLPWIMLAYNSRVHEVTRVTPLFASLGKELMLPLDVQLGIGEIFICSAIKNLQQQKKLLNDLIG